MPATSLKQKRLMDAAAHNPKFAKKVGLPMDVAKDFSESSKGMKFGSGSGTRPDRQGINKPKTDHGNSALFAKGGAMKESKAMEMKHVAAMKKAGVPKKIVAQEQAEADAMKCGGKVKKMAMGGNAGVAGGMPTPPAGMPAQANFGGAARGLDRAAAMSGRPMPTPGMGMKNGGVTRGDGIASKGKTKGRMC